MKTRQFCTLEESIPDLTVKIHIAVNRMLWVCSKISITKVARNTETCNVRAGSKQRLRHVRHIHHYISHAVGTPEFS